MKVFTVLALAASACLAMAAPKLGADECSWGPSHWCSSRKVAEKCDKLQWCRFSVGESKRPRAGK